MGSTDMMHADGADDNSKKQGQMMLSPSSEPAAEPSQHRKMREVDSKGSEYTSHPDTRFCSDIWAEMPKSPLISLCLI